MVILAIFFYNYHLRIHSFFNDMNDSIKNRVGKYKPKDKEIYYEEGPFFNNKAHKIKKSELRSKSSTHMSSKSSFLSPKFLQNYNNLDKMTIDEEDELKSFIGRLNQTVDNYSYMTNV